MKNNRGTNTEQQKFTALFHNYFLTRAHFTRATIFVIISPLKNRSNVEKWCSLVLLFDMEVFVSNLSNFRGMALSKVGGWVFFLTSYDVI